MVHLEIRPEWGSQMKDHREKIRQDLEVRFKDQSKSDLLNLQVLPELRRGYVSISHSKGLGGYAYSDFFVGFDIEVNARVKPETAARISRMEEVASAPDMPALWCAKEAVYKALAWTRQPTTVIDLTLKWTIANGEALFTLVNAKEFGVQMGRGYIQRQGEWTMAIYETSRAGA